MSPLQRLFVRYWSFTLSSFSMGEALKRIPIRLSWRVPNVKLTYYVSVVSRWFTRARTAPRQELGTKIARAGKSYLRVITPLQFVREFESRRNKRLSSC